jgi:hypothetical protein
MVHDPDNNGNTSSNVHRALIFQGEGSLGAYEAEAYKAISEELSVSLKKHDREKERRTDNISYSFWNINFS